MIFSPDAVVDPRTVVIESFNAPVADVTMPASLSPYYLALWTKVICIELLYNFEEVDFWVFGQVTWISEPAQTEKKG